MQEDKKQQQNQKDLQWALGLNRIGTQILGVWPSEEHVESEPWYVRLRVPFIIFSMILAVVMPQMYAIVKVIHELPLVIDNLMSNAASCTACVKYFFLWRNKRVLWPVIQAATQDWLRSKSERQREIMMKHAARARFFTVTGYFVMMGCYAGCAFAPILGLNIRMINNITDYAADAGRTLVVQSYFPFAYDKSPTYEILSASQIFAGIFIAMSISMPDNYFGALVFHASGQFEILADNFEYFMLRGDEAMSRQLLTQKIKELVDRHVHLISTVAAIERSFCYLMLAQVFNASLMICCIGFQFLGIIGNSHEKPSYFQVTTMVGLICALMIHLLVDCYAIVKFLLTNTQVFYSIYKSKWYALLGCKLWLRDFLPIMHASSEPQQLTGGKIFYMSLATYCDLLKSTAGYISMLIAVSQR